MHTQSPHRVLAPYGLAFPVHELVFIRAWAEGRGLAMRILLDQVRGGTVFEEMLVLRARQAAGPELRLWRVEGGRVVAQVQGRAPRVFGGIHSALSHASALFVPGPARVTSGWARLLRWRRG